MTFEKLLDELSTSHISLNNVLDELSKKEMKKKINFYSHFQNITSDPLKGSQLQELQAIVDILQILDNSSVGSPISDSDYDNMQELLVNMGIPRLTGTIEINESKKVHHKYVQLRGTLSKVYYLSSDEKRTNKSRRYLDEWIKRTESLYEKNTGKKIDLNSVKIMCQPKFDGASAILEVDEKPRWITRGDTGKNLGSDVSHIMHIFNDIFGNEGLGSGEKFEVMVTEENRNKINELIRDPNKKYKNSRQIVTATLNSNEPDFKSDYLYPVPLRIIKEGDNVERIHPMLIKKFPTMICTFGEREKIREFANNNKYVSVDGMRFRTDGVVMTILDNNIKVALGRDNNINNFEVAYKFTEETTYTRVKDIEFYVSDFGYVTPVLVVNDVILKGNTINHISLSNKERFDELNLSYGDEVKILYDIIPYATIDEKCKRVENGRKIEFIKECPRCYEPLNFDNTQVRCDNPRCPSRLVGRIMNYCAKLRIKNIGSSTLNALFNIGLLNNGIKSLYKLKKHKHEIYDLDGFGRTKTKKIISEIESKRKLNDYDFFGALGINGLSTESFKDIFSSIKLSEFINMMKMKNFDLLNAKLITINGIGSSKADILIDYLKNNDGVKEVLSILKEVDILETFGASVNRNGRAVFTGCRPTFEIEQLLNDNGYEASDKWSNSAKMLIVPDESYTSSKVEKAKSLNMPIIIISDLEKQFSK